MDTLTHALSGALVGRATWSTRSRISLKQRTQAGFLVAAFPDTDYILRFFNTDFLTYLNYHRGITHSIILLPLWALLLSLLLALLYRRGSDWKAFYFICCLGLGVHIIGDVITSYGTMIFAPFSDWRTSLDTTFIIDPFFTGIILAGLIASFTLKPQRLYASIAVVVLVSYVGLQGWAHQRAIAIGEQAADKHLWYENQISAMPQPLSPINWKIIIEHKQHYHVGLVRLFGTPPGMDIGAGYFSRIAAAYSPLDDIRWTTRHRYNDDRYLAEIVSAVWESDSIADFRRFARFPVSVQPGNSDKNCYWFADLRFELPERNNSPLFTFGACRIGTSSTRVLKHLN